MMAKSLREMYKNERTNKHTPKPHTFFFAVFLSLQRKKPRRMRSKKRWKLILIWYNIEINTRLRIYRNKPKRQHPIEPTTNTNRNIGSRNSNSGTQQQQQQQKNITSIKAECFMCILCVRDRIHARYVRSNYITNY